MTTPIAYAVRKSPEIWAALAKGFGARLAPLPFGEGRALDLSGPAILGGLQFDMPALLAAARRLRHPYLFVDNGYFATHHEGKRIRYRVTPDAYCQHWINEIAAQPAYAARFDALGLELKPWRKSGRHVLVYTSSDAHTKFFGLEKWLDETLYMVERYCDRPVVVRRKGELGPLEQELDDCWAVVTWSSKLACEATLAGVPAFTGPESGAAAVSAGILEHLETPSLVPFRREWACSLAWGQYTVDEMASGLAAEISRQAAACRRMIELRQAHA